MNTAEKDQLAAVARDAGHAAKDTYNYDALSGEGQASFNHGVHVAREAIRHGVSKEDAQEMVRSLQLQMQGTVGTLLCFVKGSSPSEKWSAK